MWRRLGKLQAELRAAQVAWAGEPTLSRYDPPFTPWFMRRNEIWLLVQSPFQLERAMVASAH